MIGPIHSEIFFQDRHMLNGVDLVLLMLSVGMCRLSVFVTTPSRCGSSGERFPIDWARGPLMSFTLGYASSLIVLSCRTNLTDDFFYVYLDCPFD